MTFSLKWSEWSVEKLQMQVHYIKIHPKVKEAQKQSLIVQIPIIHRQMKEFEFRSIMTTLK